MVVLSVDHPHRKGSDSKAVKAASALLESRGNSPRIYRNTLVFLAADQTRLPELNEAVCQHLAWEEVIAEKDRLDLSPNQVRQAEIQRNTAADTVKVRLPETYRWLLVPGQENPSHPIAWDAVQIRGRDALAVQVSKRLGREEWLIKSFAGTRLRMDLDAIPLWRGDHVGIRKLVDDFATYLYLPRLKNPSVLLDAVAGGVNLLTWVDDSFGYADSYDEASRRYRGLQGGAKISVSDENSTALVVKGEIAYRQLQAEVKPPIYPPGEPPDPPPQPPPPLKPTRFHGSTDLDAARAGRDAGEIAEEVISHLAGLVGSNVRVTLEIEAHVPDGVTESVVQTVTENCRTLRFESHGFERE